MAGNTGTYLDTPFHRYPDGFDLAGLSLEAVVDVPVSLVSTGELTSIEPDVLAGVELSGGPCCSTPAGPAFSGRRHMRPDIPT